MDKEFAIQVKDVCFTYPDGHEVLKGASCEIRAGEKVALIGPNGAGKSTFMSLLNGVSLASSGSVIISGRQIHKDNLKEIRRKVGIVFQDPDDQLFCPTVFDDVAFGPLNLDLPKDEIEARVAEALDTVGLNGFEERSSFHLSFGERKRLALATVLSYQPDILVFDEPSTNMDPLNRRKLIRWLAESNKTILLCTHDLDIALDVCDRCLMLSDGHFVADGPASDILYDRKLLEENHLELPLALMTHELLHEKLSTGQMDAEHKRIIASFLHAHRHSHGPDGHEHVHIHFHPHEHEHMHHDVPNDHVHESMKLKVVEEDASEVRFAAHHQSHDHEHSHDHHHHDHDHDHEHNHGPDKKE
jgi:cobalt/nickel transport system ATP-binding protein